MNHFLGSTCSLAALAALAATSPTLGQITLTENANGVGLVAVHSPENFAITTGPRMMGGFCVADFDNDGDPDMLFVNGGQGLDNLFINDGTGNFTDEAAAWGLTDIHTGNGAAAGDFNGDGWIDIYVSSHGDPDDQDGSPGEMRLYQNNGGTGFTEVAQTAGVAFSSPTAASAWGSAWGDYDLDGDLDLATAGWATFSEGNRLFENNGDGTFTDVTYTALDNPELFLAGKGFQPVFADLNGDLYPEFIFIADFLDSHTYLNNGDGTFTDVTESSSTGLEENGMGIALADFDCDGLLDFYTSSVYWDSPPSGFDNGQMFYWNQGLMNFLEVAATNGTEDGGWGWGPIAVDLDLDGYEDIVQVNGWYPYQVDGEEWNNERAKLFHNQGNGFFNEIAEVAGLSHTDRGRAISYMDLDLDGDLDFVIGSRQAPLQCFINTTPNPGNYLRVSLDTQTNALLAPNGFNARIYVTTGKHTQQRYICGSPSYLATSELVAHFGLGDATNIDTLEVLWPRGQSTIMTDVAVDQMMTITAPALGDFDADGNINVTDMLELIANWGPICDSSCLYLDINNDGIVDVSDLLYVIANWS